MSVDVQKIQDACMLSTKVYEVPVSVMIIMVFLWQTAGTSSMAALVLLMIVIPLNAGLLGNKIRKLQVGKLSN